MPTATSYEMTNTITKAVRSYKTRNAATKAADRADTAYGRTICTVRPVWPSETPA